MISLSLFIFAFMTLTLATLNTGGCSETLKNLSVRTYVDLTLHNPDIVLLQETNTLNANSSCWSHWPYSVHCAQSNSRGTGVATLFKNSCNYDILKSTVVFPNYLLYNQLKAGNVILHIYNVLIPQADAKAKDCIEAFLSHSSNHSDGSVIIGGDLNCTINPALDRFHNPCEKRRKVAQALQNSFDEIGVCDVWRRRNPTSREYTWFRSRATNVGCMSKARLDKFLISNDLLPTVSACKIVTCAISDHSTVSLTLKTPSVRKTGSSHWHFNNSLLKNKEYTDSISLFLRQWRLQKANFSDINTWWDVGKRNIKTLSQMLGTKNARNKREAAKVLNNKIEELLSSTSSSVETQNTLKAEIQSLKYLYEQEARGALVRARFQHASEIDTCSNYFFSMEKSRSSSKHVSQIRLSSGIVTDDPTEIASHVHSFYRDLYKRVETDEEAIDSVLQNFPSLDPCDAEDCDRPITAEELNLAVGQLAHNKAPGLDGLTSEFFQFFWPILKEDFFQVLTYSISSGSLPVSCRRAVITLLPKKGDLVDIANWRPVSLLNTDYKIFAKVLTNRLKTVIGQIVQPDQSYGVPERTIYDNINLIRDSLTFCNTQNSPLALLNLDQKKAFDNVDHDYLFRTMRAMGFGRSFISYVQTMYSGTQSMVKVGNSLTSPFPFEKGIRQGCPLSGLLYSIAIEPFLHTLRAKLSDSGLLLPCTSSKSVVVSAYADDVTIFVTRDRDFEIVESVYDLYSRASAARLNRQKTQGLWVGSWTDRKDTPLGYNWTSEGLVFLGVHLGNSNLFVQQNWAICRLKVDKCLSNWKRLSRMMSFKGRVLIANQLAASKIFHLLATASPPEHVLAELQEKLVNFIFNDGRHWLGREIVHQNPIRGGLGLACLQARMLTFRYKLLISFLSNPDHHPSYSFMRHFFRQYRKLGVDREVFATNLQPQFFIHLPTFHSELMHAWDKIGARFTTLPQDYDFCLNMPITSYLFKRVDRDDSGLVGRLAACGIRLVGDLLDSKDGSWLPPEHLQAAAVARLSARRLTGDLNDIRNIISPVLNARDLGTTRDAGSPVPLDITITGDGNGVTATTKAVYDILNGKVNSLPSNTTVFFQRTGIIPQDRRVPWKNIYHLPTSKREGDAQYRLLHNILPSLQVLHHLDADIPRLCGWCGEEGTITHLFVTCPAIQPSLTLLHTLLHRLLPGSKLDFTDYWMLIPHAKSRPREVVRICNYLIMSLKHVIYRLYSQSKFYDPFVMWQNRLKYKITSEYLFYKSCKDLQSFQKKWDYKNAIFMFHDSEITWMI